MKPFPFGSSFAPLPQRADGSESLTQSQPNRGRHSRGRRRENPQRYLELQAPAELLQGGQVQVIERGRDERRMVPEVEQGIDSQWPESGDSGMQSHHLLGWRATGSPAPILPPGVAGTRGSILKARGGQAAATGAGQAGLPGVRLPLGRAHFRQGQSHSGPVSQSARPAKTWSRAVMGASRVPVARVSAIRPVAWWSWPSRWPLSCRSTLSRSRRPCSPRLSGVVNSLSSPGVASTNQPRPAALPSSRIADPCARPRESLAASPSRAVVVPHGLPPSSLTIVPVPCPLASVASPNVSARFTKNVSFASFVASP